MKGKPSRPPDRETRSQAVVRIRVQPRASRNEVTFGKDGSLKIRLTAPPVDGAANEALVKCLAEALGISRSRIEILSGLTGRDKRIGISGVSEEDLRALLLKGSE